MPNATPAGPSADRNLLFGILAVQMDFISRDALIAAMHAWVLAKHRPLGELLQEQGALTLEDRQALDQFVAAHLRVHGGDVQRSLAAVAHPSTLGDIAQSVADPDLEASLAAAGATLATTDDFRPAEDGLRYHILRPHAQGGLGVVSVARDAELGREVAFKEIQARFAENATLRGRFVREAEITGGLEHPGIVPVYGLGRYADGRPYYVMRFIRGESLREATAQLHAGKAGYTLRGLLTRFAAVCNAVAYAHSRGVIHRDLKPANVMLGPYGETLVVDWGLAKVVGRQTAEVDGPGELTLRLPSGEGSLTQAGKALGTPAFMSPEQARGEVDGLGPPTDVYSLGATLYAVLTDRPPVQGRDTAEVLEKVRRGDWRPPRQVSAAVPRALDAVCRKAMALHPADRYDSALELAADVERWLADEPVSAWREPWPTRAGRWVRRHRTKVAAAVAACFVALLLSGAGLAWQQRERERQRQEQYRRRAGSETALRQVRDLQSRAQWAEARTALARAEERLGEGDAEDLRQTLVAARKELELVVCLDDLRLDRGSQTQGTGFNPVAPDRRYEALFRESGLGRPGDDPGVAGLRVADSVVHDQLVAALDNWAFLASAQRRAWVLEVARRADPDPWRDRLRDPAAWDNVTALARLAREAPPKALTPSLAAAVADCLGLMPEAVKLLRAAQALRPGDFWVNYSLGQRLVRERPAEAEGFFRVALAVGPNSGAAHSELATCLGRQGKLDEAATLWRMALESSSGSPLACYIIRRELASLLERQGKWDEAAALWRQAQGVDPKDSSAYSELAEILQRQGNYDEAGAVYRKMLEAYPKDAGTSQRFAELLEFQGKREEAAAMREAATTSCRTALEAQPRDTVVRGILARRLERQGKCEEAAAHWRRRLEDDPTNAGTVIEFGSLLERQGKAAEAAASYRQAAKIIPGAAYAFDVDLARVLLAMGQYQQAKVAAHSALEHSSPWEIAKHQQAKTYERLAELGERLQSVLRGEDRPANAAESIDFAELCWIQRCNTNALHLSSAAFSADPKLANDLKAALRYKAACYAASAGSRTCNGDDQSSNEECVRLRLQAREWLRADLAICRKLADSGEYWRASDNLARWQRDRDLSAVRDLAGLARLPQAERKEWEAFWAEVKAVLASPPAR
jgi:tetratricopeptide (TPR) repeat protein